MGCQNSNIAQIIPVDAQQIPQPQPQHQHQPQNTIPTSIVSPSPNRKDKQLDKQNKLPPLQLSIKVSKQAGEVPLSSNAGDITKRKAQSQNRIAAEELMNDKTNTQHTREQKKKSIVISEKTKTLSARANKEKTVNKIENQVIVGPSTHSIPTQTPPLPQEMTVPIVVQKQTKQPEHKLKEELHPVDSLSEQLTSQRLSKSFKFQVFIDESNQLLSKTQRLNKQLEQFVEKEQVAKYLTMIEYGQKEEILGKLYTELQKKEEWNDASSELSNKQPNIVVVTEHGQTAQH